MVAAQEWFAVAAVLALVAMVMAVVMLRAATRLDNDLLLNGSATTSYSDAGRGPAQRQEHGK